MYSNILSFSSVSAEAGRWMVELGPAVGLFVAIALAFLVADFALSMVQRARGGDSGSGEGGSSGHVRSGRINSGSMRGARSGGGKNGGSSDASTPEPAHQDDKEGGD